MIQPDAQQIVFAEYASESPAGREITRSLFGSRDHR